MQKCVLCHMWTTNVQISLRIRAIQSFKILASFCSWAGWFKPYLAENPGRHIFAWCGSYTLFVYQSRSTVMILSFKTDMPGQTVDPDQTAPREAVWSGSTLFAIPSASFRSINLWHSLVVQILEWLQQIFRMSEFLGFLPYTVRKFQYLHVQPVEQKRWVLGDN